MGKRNNLVQRVKLEDPKFLAFVNKQDSKNTRKTYENYSKVILAFSQTSGEAMLNDKENYEQFKLFEFKQWLEVHGYSPYYIESIIGCLRSFFRTFKKPLTIDRMDCRKLNKRHRKNLDFYPKKEHFTAMYTCPNGTETERITVFLGVSLGLRAEDYCKVTVGQLREAMKDTEEPKSLGRIVTEKEDVYAYPFLSHDAQEIVKVFLANHPDTKDNDKVFNGCPNKLSSIVRNLADKSGVQYKPKRLVFHCLRKVLFNALNTKMGDKSKYIVGKACEEKAYLDNDVTELREGYRDAESIFSANGKNGTSPETKQKLSALESENLALKERIKELEEKQGTATSTTADNQTRIEALEHKIQQLIEVSSNSKTSKP